ncbi:MAG: FTR1 family protein [Methylophilaceae bacterium]
MFETAIIVFREVLEAAIIIGIVAAATREVPGRHRWLIAGLVAGLIGSAIVAASTDAIANFASGVGQELFNAIVLGIAVLMLAWHNIWMTSHGAELASHAKNVGINIREGRSESSILMLVVGLAVLREGSETVLFLYGISTSANSSANAMLLGGLAGALAGVVVGYTLYAGLLRIPMRWFFNVTSILVLLLAAGMASTAAKFLIQADLLPALATPLWNTSATVPEGSVVGMLLHSLIGYDARPAGMQVIFYIAVILTIGLGMKFMASQKHIKHH